MHYPTNLQFNETVLSSYMIPDGVHKCEYDISVFRYFFQDQGLLQNADKLNKQHIEVLLFEFSGSSWSPYQETKVLKIRLDAKKGELHLEDTSTVTWIKFKIHKDL